MIKFCGNCGADIKDTNGVCLNCLKKNPFSNNGIINREAIKRSANELLDKCFWKIFIGCFFVYGLIFLVNILKDSLLNNYFLFNTVCSIFEEFVFIPLCVGLLLYIVKVVRNENARFTNIFEYYDKRIFYIFGLSLLTFISISVGMIFLIIPGIILAISFSMCFYIYIDNENLGLIKNIEESFKLIKGYKVDILMFFLSFIGWILLGFLTYGIAFIYVIPYIQVSFIKYYDELKRIKNRI